MSYRFREWYIPERMLEGLRRYIDHGVPTGDFLRLIISNDFVHAVGHADDENVRNLPAYAGYMYNEMPGGSYGSKERYNGWISQKRVEREASEREAQSTEAQQTQGGNQNGTKA